MKNWLRKLATVVSLSIASGGCSEKTPAPAPATSEQFRENQVWEYKTRPGEEGSRVTIGRIEQVPNVGVVVHVKLTGVRIKNEHSPDGWSTELSHAPISEKQLAASVIRLVDEPSDLSGFEEGYATWLEAKGGVFTITLAEIVQYMEEAISQHGF